MPTYTYGTTEIDYDLEYRHDKRDILISVEWQNGVRVVVPPSVDQTQLDQILRKKAPWILSKWRAFNEIAEPPARKEFVSGEKFPYLGRHYRLKVIQDDAFDETHVQLLRGRFICYLPTKVSNDNRQKVILHAFKKWYLQHGEQKIHDRMAIYTEKMNITYSNLQLKEQKMRWGTCTADGSIYLNWRIVMAPISIIDYLLVHELAHIVHANHSKDFWRLVGTILPDFEERKEWLRVNGPLLTIQ
ncbi:M48 family metallopeptidase [Alkalihalophilus marmarensis]|uniref:M48 family metallopeptidase n=1 Tax=Alkalihalophilus marmarensis TaxID=521377 RepID=UPI002DC05B31|nr:SprT family zinc-dependent metalloprotease [Alkalihalophilus marmarensis]MEC2072481.1 SprT family zinc-dependent metalloprotease [Alkalihalophilus marmarensis]